MRVLLYTMLFLSTQLSFATGEGIQFTDLSFKKVVAQAVAENKIIFIDAYTTWCAPCRLMDRETFKNPEVAAYFNENFINLKMDMESGIGKSIAARYAVRSYPTFLFINGDEQLVHRSSGYQRARSFIQQGRTALRDDNDFNLQQRYDSGDRSLDFMFQYISSFAGVIISKPTDKLIRETIADHKDDWLNPYIIGLLMYLPDHPDTACRCRLPLAIADPRRILPNVDHGSPKSPRLHND